MQRTAPNGFLLHRRADREATPTQSTDGGAAPCIPARFGLYSAARCAFCQRFSLALHGVRLPILVAEALHKTFGPRTILGQVAFSIHRGERIGLVGKNGSGKSTLAKILAGLDEIDSGTLSLRRGARILYLEQNPQFAPGQSALEVVLGGLREWCEAREHHRRLTEFLHERSGAELQASIEQQAQAAAEIERLGGWERVHHAQAALAKLGIANPEAAIETLSGGELRRVALARALLTAPDLLILDEPTNHLDLASIEWLETELCERFPNAVLLITHDRCLLDRVTTRTLELHDALLDAYEGGYSEYLEGKALREEQAQRTERNRQNFLRRELDWLRRQPKARSGKQKARTQRAATVLDIPRPKYERAIQLETQTSQIGKSILRLDHLGLRTPEKLLFENLTLELQKGDRIGIVGPNGSGKTSLLRCITGELKPSTGRIAPGKNTKFAYLDQARSGLDPKGTIHENVAQTRSEILFGEDSIPVRNYLERFLFDSTAQRKLVGTLSGGERARVALAKLLAEPCNLLLLDEPTNDLDVETLSALEAMLQDFAGSLFVVSHDRWLLDRVTTKTLVLDGAGKIEISPGNYSAYLERREAKAKTEQETKTSAPTPKRDTEPKKRKALTYAEKLELETILERIASAELKVQELETKLSDPALYARAAANNAQGDDASAVTAAFETAKAELDSLLARWEELETKRTEGERAG